MALNKGKAFEQKIKECWYKTMPDSFLLRLPDQQSGYHLSSNVADFIGFKTPKLFLIECKSIETNTINFSYLRQYDKLLEYKDITEVYPGFIIWWVKLDKIAWIPIKTAERLKAEGQKSINVKILDDPDYETLLIPSVKKRTFMDSDLSILMTLTNKN